MGLLNRLYSALDSLLNKYGVWKIETIGDCYVAVAGLDLKGFSYCPQNSRGAGSQLNASGN